MRAVLLGIAVAAIIFTILVSNSIKKAREFAPTLIKIGDAEIRVEVANTPTSRAKGLMGRESLGKDRGMLFIFPREAKHAFWMANTLIPLDMIWIDSTRQIVHIEENVPPCTETGTLKSLCTTYKSKEDAKFTLETNAGWVAKNGVTVGMEVRMFEE